MYKLKPSKGLLAAALFVFIVGGLVTVYFFGEDAYGDDNHRWLFALIVTVVLTVVCLIAATANMWFRHLWHHRPGYKRG